MSGFAERSTSFIEDGVFSSRKPRDAFGKDLELFPINIRDASDLKRLNELNPMLQTGTAKPKSAEYLHLEEFEDGSEMGESRVMANMTTALGSTYLWMAVGGTSAAIAAYGPSVFVSQRELPFRLKYTTIVNFAARSALRMGFAGATTAVSFVVAQGVLEAIRQRRDSWNTLMSGLFAGFVLNIGGGFKLGITRSVLASCFVVAIPIVQNAIEKKVSEETKEKVAATWDRYKLGTLLGWNSNSEERLPTRHKF